MRTASIMIRPAAVVLLLVLFGFRPGAKAQEIETPKVELYRGYDYVRNNANPRINGVPPSESFGANGISGQAPYDPNSRVGILGGLSGYSLARTRRNTTMRTCQALFIVAIMTPDALHGQQTMNAAAANDGQPAKNESRGVLILRDADETAWVGNLEYYHPQPGFDRANRDIDVENARISRAWHFPVGWEFQVGGLFFRASGTRTIDTPSPATERSDALGFGLSPAVRWNFLEFRRARFLGDLAPGINFTNNAFPAGGTNYSFFLRAGAGASFRLSARYWVEAAYWWTHISNGQGIGLGNPTWQGEGLTLGLRRANRPEPSSAMAGGKLLPERPGTKENGWLTEGEYLVRDSGSNAVGTRSGLQLYRVARAWHFTNGLELQFGGLIFPSPSASGFGPQLRWNFQNRERWHLFVRGEPDFIKTGFFFIPLGGDQYNFLFQVGGGASYRLRSSYWLEGSYSWGHTLDGWNSKSGYSSWSGQGVAIGIRHTFR